MARKIRRRKFIALAAGSAVALPLATRIGDSRDAALAVQNAGDLMPPAGGHPWSSGFRSLNTDYDYWVEDVDGKIPPDLIGTLFRNGPAKNSLGGHWFAHWFDGDGMIARLCFERGRIHFKNRFVETMAYLNEKGAGRILYRGFGNQRPGGALMNALRSPKNAANTSVVYYNQQLLALWEGGPPTAIAPYNLSTLGSNTFGGSIKAFSAHPKIDTHTGRLFNFGIDYGRSTKLRIYRMDRQGELAVMPPIDPPGSVMNHDFAITQRYLVFCFGPIVEDVFNFYMGLGSFDRNLEWRSSRPTTILLVPRNLSQNLTWIETDPSFQFHFANAYDDGKTVVVDLARYHDYSVVGDALRNFWRSAWPRAGMATLTRLRIDPAARKVESHVLGGGESVEFPQINRAHTGHHYRYAYVTGLADGAAGGLWQTINKIDVDHGAVTTHSFAPDGYAGEPVFIPRLNSKAEDDGYLVTLVYNASKRRTDVVILDARDIAAKPVAVAHLINHVPFGFHGFFTEEIFAPTI